MPRCIIPKLKKTSNSKYRNKKDHVRRLLGKLRPETKTSTEHCYNPLRDNYLELISFRRVGTCWLWMLRKCRIKYARRLNPNFPFLLQVGYGHSQFLFSKRSGTGNPDPPIPRSPIAKHPFNGLLGLMVSWAPSDGNILIQSCLSQDFSVENVPPQIAHSNGTKGTPAREVDIVTLLP